MDVAVQEGQDSEAIEVTIILQKQSICSRLLTHK